MKNILALLMALAMVLAVCSFSVSAEEYQLGTYVISVGDPDPAECFLNVRAGMAYTPGYSTILGQVWDGDEVEVTEIVNNDWGKIDFEGQEGWIRLKYATFVPDEIVPDDTTSDDTTSDDTTSDDTTSDDTSSDEPIGEEKLCLKEESSLTRKEELYGLILGVKEGQTAEEIINEFEEGNIVVLDGEGNAVEPTAKVGTGYSVVLYTYDNEIAADGAYLIVKGDVTGDGVVDSTDYLRIKSNFLEKFTLEDVFVTAADVDDSSAIDTTDYMRIKGHFLGTYQLFE